MNSNFLFQTMCNSICWAGCGYVIGHIASPSPEKVAVVFAVSSIAQSIFRLMNFYAYSPKNAKDYRDLNAGTDLLTTCVTAVALHRMQLLNGVAAYYVALGSLFMTIIKITS